jgi:hypothetical protein
MDRKGQTYQMTMLKRMLFQSFYKDDTCHSRQYYRPHCIRKQKISLGLARLPRESWTSRKTFEFDAQWRENME